MPVKGFFVLFDVIIWNKLTVSLPNDYSVFMFGIDSFRQMLFEQEDSNLYAEPVILAKMAVDYLKVCKLGAYKISTACVFNQWTVNAHNQIKILS